MIFYDKENKRLAYFEEKADPDFWDRHWQEADFKMAVERGKDNKFCLNTLREYIPDKRGQILEGGCGQGQLVYCMHVHGYEVIGVDFAEKTIRRIKEVFPELNVRIGDVRNLPFPDNHFMGYWSLGVIEHFWDGYDDIISEMRRVLVKNGYVFLAFPYMSLLRRLKAKFELYNKLKLDQAMPEDFYQFVLNAEIVIKDFEAAGFRMLARHPIGGIKGFKDEINPFRPLLQKYFDYQGRQLWILGSRLLLDKILATFSGHSLFVVFQKISG